MAQLTVIATGPTDGLLSLVVVTLALLLTVPQVAGVVGEMMWTWKVAPGARSSGPNFSTPATIAPLRFVHPASMLQAVPAFVGSVSLTMTLRAMPAPLLVIVTT